MIKLRVVIILSVLLLVVGFFTVSYANPEDELKISIKAGYNDTIRIYSECPFYIEIENNGKDFQGEIQIHRILNNTTKFNYALPFELPQGSKKEFSMSLPINEAKKDVEIKIVSNKELLSKKYQFKEIISPETPVVGLLTNAPNKIRGLYDIKLSERTAFGQGGNIIGINYSLYEKPSTSVGAKRDIKVIELDEISLPDNERLLSTFDFIIISDYDTSLLSDSQKTAISNWVDNGNTLVIGTGENARKVYSGLDENLKPFKIYSQKTIQMPESLADFTERAILEEQMKISTGSIENGSIIIGDKDTPLAINYTYGNGNITVLSFDPTTRPISNWDYSKDMWERLLEYNREEIDYWNSNGYYGNYVSYVSDLSDEGAFPLVFLCIIILVYIIIAGPVLYWILKHKDKRDYSWIIIPSLALLFVGIIYMGGFKTRNKASIINSYSIIELDSETEKMNVSSFAEFYNNKKGTFKIEYPSSYNLELYLRDNYYHDYMSNDPDITNKITFGEPEIHEIYNKPLWSAEEAMFSMSREYDEKIILQDVKLTEDKISGIIKNNTSFVLEDCYIVIEGIYISVGNFNPKDERKLELSFSNSSVKYDFDLLMDEIYPKTNNYSYYSASDETREQQRKRRAYEIAYNDYIRKISSQNLSKGKQIIFLALNYEDIGYKFKINEKAPKIYNTNIIYTTENIEYQKGENIILQKGSIKPILDNIEDFGMEDYMEYVFYGDTEARLTFNVPRDLKIQQFEIDWTNIPYHLFYTDESIENKIDNYSLYIKNYKTNQWEEMNNRFRVDTNVEHYINKLNQIEVKADITFTEYNYGSDYLIIPEIQVSGVVD